MRVIPMPVPSAQPHTPVPATPSDRDSAAVTWCRDIASAVATALDSDAEQVGYRLTPRPGLPAPHTLHTTFTVAGPAGRRHRRRSPPKARPCQRLPHLRRQRQLAKVAHGPALSCDAVATFTTHRLSLVAARVYSIDAHVGPMNVPAVVADTRATSPIKATAPQRSDSLQTVQRLASATVAITDP